MGFLNRLFVVLAPCAALAATVAASAVFRRRDKLLRLTSKIPAEAHKVSQLNSSVYELYTPPGEPSMEVLFFHGFQHGDYKDAHLSTWKCGDGSSIWPQTWLVETFHDARILSVSYDASVINSCEGGNIDMHLISENLTSDLLSANIGQEPCRPVVLVGHSFGGLVIKQICVYASSTTGRLGRNSEKKFQLTTFLENVRGIFFYSTPHQGVVDRIAEHFVAEGPLLEYVKTLSTPRARVNFDFDNLCGQDGQYKMWQIAGLGESIRTKSGSFSDMIVQEASARYGTSFNIVEGADHISVCRPMEKTCRSFSALTIFLEGVAADSKATVYGLPDFPTALERRVFDVEQKLANTPVLGIVGMGGIGKTTIAKELFNKISRQFEYTCFVDNVKGMTVRELNDWLLNHFLRNGTTVNQNSLQWSDLQKKKSLITMDDVDSQSQVRILPTLEHLGSGSRVIFTTRDKGVLNTLPNCVIYEVDFLKPDEAKKLFCQHAFQQEGIPDSLTQVNRHLQENVTKVVEKCAGLPLTLEVMGCYLRDHQTNAGVWKETLDKLGKAQSVDGLRKDRVWSSLRLSYDALSPEEQGVFLEAGTCFFEKPVEIALAAWSTAFGYSESRWTNLLRTSLVKEVDITERDYEGKMDIKYKEVWVHEHLRDLANHLSKGAMISMSLRESNGAVDLLNANAVQPETSMLKLWDYNAVYDDSTLQLELLDKFEKLKYLDVHGISPEGSSSTLSRKLCLLKCSRTHTQQRRVLPFTLEDMNNLAVLDLKRWAMAEESLEALEKLGNLRILSLHDISGPSRLPDNFGHLHQLKRLELQHVWFTALPDSFGNLSALQHLLLSDLDELLALPESFGNLSSLATLRIVRCFRLARLPESFGKLSSLATFAISQCYMLAGLPESLGNLSSLAKLAISDCFITAGLPESFGNLSSLATLSISYCDYLASLPDSFGHLSSLTELRIKRCASLSCQQPTELRQFGLHENLAALRYLSLKSCPSLERLPASFERLSALEEVKLFECTQLKTLPESIGQFKSLKRLIIKEAEHLEALPDSFGILPALTYLRLSDCDSLQRLPASFGNLSALQKLELENCLQLQKLPDNFCQVRALKNLTIESCTRLEALPEDFGNLVSLTSLRLFKCRSLQRLPESFGLLSALQELELTDCTELQRLPDNFGQLSALKTLSIRGADHLEELPDSLGNLSSLEDLRIRADRLQRFPVSIGQLQALKKMTVEAEMLRSLPEELGNLCSLEMLRIERCVHLEALPDSLGHMSALGVVLLYQCNELKSLPDNLGKNFWPHGDRSTETRRPVAGHSCQIASTEGFLLHICSCQFLGGSVLRLVWIESGRKYVFGEGDNRISHWLDGRWYRRKCHCESIPTRDPDPLTASINYEVYRPTQKLRRASGLDRHLF